MDDAHWLAGRREDLAGLRHGEAQGVMDGAGGDLVVAGEAGEDRQAGGVGGGPGVRVLVVGGHIPDGCGGGAPLAAGEMSIAELIEPAAILFDHEHVTVAVAGFGVTLDESGRADGHRTRVAFGGVGAR
jgi:hypothetical protein